jgi:hypothetical protein
MALTRTQNEILVRIEAIKKDDFLGFQTSELFFALDFEHGKPFVRDGVTKEEYEDTRKKAKGHEPVEALKLYMPVAWTKANDCRGISANRSIDHIISWLWLAGEDNLLARVEDEYDLHYEFYGKPILEMVCEHFGVDWKVLDNGKRVNSDSE